MTDSLCGDFAYHNGMTMYYTALQDIRTQPVKDIVNRRAIAKILHGSVFNVAFAAVIAVLMFGVPLCVLFKIILAEV